MSSGCQRKRTVSLQCKQEAKLPWQSPLADTEGWGPYTWPVWVSSARGKDRSESGVPGTRTPMWRQNEPQSHDPWQRAEARGVGEPNRFCFQVQGAACDGHLIIFLSLSVPGLETEEFKVLSMIRGLGQICLLLEGEAAHWQGVCLAFRRPWVPPPAPNKTRCFDPCLQFWHWGGGGGREKRIRSSRSSWATGVPSSKSKVSRTPQKQTTWGTAPERHRSWWIHLRRDRLSGTRWQGTVKETWIAAQEFQQLG